MHDRRGEIEGRLRRTLDERLRPARRTTVSALTVEVWHVPPTEGLVGEPVPFSRARAATYAPCAVGERWGRAWGTSWFRVTGDVPPDLATPEVVIDLGWTHAAPGFEAEGLVVGADGGTIKGLNPLNDWVPAQPGERLEWYVEAAANPTLLTGWAPTAEGDRLTASERQLYTLARADTING